MKFEVDRPQLQENESFSSRGNTEKHLCAETSIHCVCPWCSRTIVTQVDRRSTWISVLLFVSLFLLLHIFSFCVYPFLSPFTQEIIHTCPRCGGEVSRSRRFELPRLSHEVITIRCGSCAVVVSRKYLIGAFCCVCLVCGASTLRWCIKTFALPDIEPGPFIGATWQDYVQDCGVLPYKARTSLGNPLHALYQFQEYYYGKTVSWEGRLLEVKEGFFRKNLLLLVMQPHQYTSVALADLAMIYNGVILDDQVKDLMVGDKIAFNATLLELGKRGRPHLGAIFNLKRVELNSNLPDLFENETFDYFQRPPIAYLPEVVNRVGQMRKQMISQMDEERGFLVGGELVGAPVLKPSSREIQSRTGDIR